MSSRYPLYGLAVLIPIVALFIGLALRDARKYQKRAVEFATAHRDEYGRRILPATAPNMSYASLQAQVNELAIRLDQHLELHNEWEKTDQILVSSHAELGREMMSAFQRIAADDAKLKERFPNEPDQQDN